jgi:zinc protease
MSRGQGCGRRRAALALGAAVAAIAGCASDPPPAPTLPSRTVSVEIQTPDPAWSIEIVEARLVEGELWVLSELSRRDGPAPQVISSASDSAQVTAPPDAPVTHYILGKTWQWGDERELRFIDHRRDLDEAFRRGLRVYP